MLGKLLGRDSYSCIFTIRQFNRHEQGTALYQASTFLSLLSTVLHEILIWLMLNWEPVTNSTLIFFVYHDLWNVSEVVLFKFIHELQDLFHLRRFPVPFLFHVVYFDHIEGVTIVSWADLLILLVTLNYLDPLVDVQILESWNVGHYEIRVLTLLFCRFKIWRVMYEIMNQSKTSIPDIIICQFILDIGDSYQVFAFQGVTYLRLDLISIVYHPIL